MSEESFDGSERTRRKHLPTEDEKKYVHEQGFSGYSVCGVIYGEHEPGGSPRIDCPYCAQDRVKPWKVKS